MKVYQKKTVHQKSGKAFGISLKLQLIAGFAVPIILLIAVGMISYYNASSGMIENYENAAVNALDMTMECLERGVAPCVANALELANNTTVSSYIQGGYDSDTKRQSSVRQSVTKDILVKQTTNDFIKNIHIIPNGDILALTTANTSNSNVQGFMQKLRESEDQRMVQQTGIMWGSRHPFIDERCGLSEEDYILYCSCRVGSKEQGGLVLVDIRAEAVLNLMEQLEFSEGSHMAFITADGRELGWNETVKISELDFYTGEDATQYVKYDGQDYFYMAKQSETTGGSFVVMVPKASITGKADHIKRITLILVVLASVTAVLLGFIIITGISTNIGASIHTLNEIANGNLVVKPLKNKKHEFGRLFAAIQNTVKKITELLEAVKQINCQVPIAGEQGIKGALTPTLGGDLKCSQNEFVLQPVSAEDLHNNKSSRNFWCWLGDHACFSATGACAGAESTKFTSRQACSVLTAGPMWHEIQRKPNEYVRAVKNSRGDDPVLPGAGINGWTVTLISKNCKRPDRAIEFMTYLMSEKGQRMTYFGVEGVTYDLVDGAYVIKPEVQKVLDTDRVEYDRLYGADNTYWMLQNTVMQLPWKLQPAEYLRQLEEWTYPYTHFMGQYELTFQADTEAGNNYNKIKKLWGETLPRLLLAPSEEEFDRILDGYTASREQMGYQTVLQEVQRQIADAKRKLGFDIGTDG